MPAKKKAENQYVVCWPEGGPAEWSEREGTFYRGRVASLFSTRGRANRAVQSAKRYWRVHHEVYGDPCDPKDYAFYVTRATVAR